MCLPGQPPAPPSPASAADAVAMARAGLGWLAGADVASLPAAVQADCLRALEQAEAVHTAARARVLAAFHAGGGFQDDGHGSAKTWLWWQTRVTRGAAAMAMAWMRRLAAHPAVGGTLAAGEVSVSWARQVCGWSDQLPAQCRADGGGPRGPTPTGQLTERRASSTSGPGQRAAPAWHGGPDMPRRPT